jgi:predicted phage-related endonuclease
MAVQRIPITSREQWLELRKQDVTASAIGALFGVHPWQTIAGLYAEKCGMDLPAPDPESSVIRRGNALESVVAAEVAKLRPEWLINKNAEYLRDSHARIGATPDFWIDGDPRGRGVLQTKTIGSYAFKKYWAGDYGEDPSPPLWIILQNATEVMLADAAFGAVGVLVLGDFAFDCHVIEVPRHKPTEHHIRVAVNLFWQALDAGQVPTIDYERDGDLVKLMYPREAEGKIIDLRGDNRIQELCEIRARNAAMIAVAEKEKKAAETEMRAKIGDAEIAIVNGWKISLKTTHRPEIVQKAVDYRVLRSVREKVE